MAEKTMQSLLYHSHHNLHLTSLLIPTPSPTQLLLQIQWCGICGTDLHEYLVGPLVTPRTPHTITNEKIPVTLGHEFTGRIVKIGEEVEGFEEGGKVVVDPRVNCSGKCWVCADLGASNVCPSWGFIGLSGGGGGFAEFICVEARQCYKLPEGVEMDAAALIEPLAVGRHALTVSGISDFSEKTVLVVGGGPIGLSVLWNLKAVGVGRVVVSEPTKLRQERAKELADEVVNPLEENVGDKCRGLTGGKGVDVVFDCAGILAGLKAGMDAVRHKGVWVNVAGWEKPMEIPLQYAMMKELTLKFSMAYDEKDFGAVVEDFVDGKFKGVEGMITGRIGIEEVVERGFEELVRNREGHVKILVTPRKEKL